MNQKVEAFIEKWAGTTFESSIVKTEQFKSFARAFRNAVKASLPKGAELVNVNTGHFYVSGFIRHKEKHMYFSTSDVRFFPEEWHKHILTRIAAHDHDYTGGQNWYVFLSSLTEMVGRLTGGDTE